MTREAGEITRLAFVAECTVSGSVTIVEDIFGPDADGYLIADRVAAPAQFLADVPEFAAMIGVPADAGTILSITFTVDVDFGFPVSFVAATSVSGPVTLLAGGDVAVDGATLPSAVIDDVARATLTEAAELGVDATVAITGNGNLQVKSDVPELEITLAVSYTAPAESVAPSASASASPSPSGALLPDTSTGEETSSGAGDGLVLVAMLLMLVACASVRVRALVTARRR